MGRDGSIIPVDDGSGRGGSLTKKMPESRSWLQLDALGQEMNMEADKYVIMNRVQIHARDIRIIDPFLSYPSKILSRERAIVLNLEVLILNPMDENVIPIVEELRRRLPLGNGGESSPNEIETEEEYENPFELRALDVILEAICSHLDARSTELETAVYTALDMLTLKITHRNLDKLRKLKNQMTRLTSRVQKVRDELHDLLDDDHLMSTLYLSRKLGAVNWSMSIHHPKTASKTTKPSRGSALVGDFGDDNDIQELEMLLEAYFSQIDNTFDKLARVRDYIDSTEDYLNIQLDNRRNKLYQLDLFFNAGVVALAINAIVSGFFGMNFNFTWSLDGYGYTFKWVVVFSSLLTAVVFILIVEYARHKGLFGAWTNS
ncbi:OLC1v1019862C1 [Oldenlandia corymbosa var. corymbosa]|uniref:Magnesium transporter n=1 Tax=Oldenlandia corymbosa var. corymbosa TaxID=529605 RepID=A0AAV1EFG9_OLDCO|nr:OLC1v1019862C1 [Oldenlandia corymbosa var. corymbosa]